MSCGPGWRAARPILVVFTALSGLGGVDLLPPRPQSMTFAFPGPGMQHASVTVAADRKVRLGTLWQLPRCDQPLSKKIRDVGVGLHRFVAQEHGSSPRRTRSATSRGTSHHWLGEQPVGRRRLLLAASAEVATVFVLGSEPTCTTAEVETSVSGKELMQRLSWQDSQMNMKLGSAKLGDRAAVLDLEPCGGGYCVEFMVDGKGPFRAVVDTGSPFFTITGGCGGGWGCFTGEGQPSGLVRANATGSLPRFDWSYA